MKTKTFKLGEVCKGGIITVEIKNNVIDVIGKDWDFNTGSNKSSDQSKAKEFTRLTVKVTDPQAETQIDDFLNDLTTSYHSEEVMKWIKTKVTLAKSLHW